MQKIGIVSYCDTLRTDAHFNHQDYAARHDYTAVFDIAPTNHRPFKNKIEKIQKFLPLFKGLFWVDDDIFFTQPDQTLESRIEGNEDKDLVICRSPLNTDDEGRTIWTHLTSGSFFVRNTPHAHEFLAACLTTSVEKVRETWSEERHGLFTNGDQDIITHLLDVDPRFNDPGFHALLPYETFNTRPFHFQEASDEHFLVHFTGKEKRQQIAVFAGRFGLSSALIPQADLDRLHGMRAESD